VAVILAIQARRSIQRSNGTETGAGLAIAGLVLGIVGLIGAVVTTALVVAVGITANNAARDAIQQFTNRRVEVPAGRTVTVTTSDFSFDAGIKTVTVFAVIGPVSGQSPADVPEPGKEFAVADIQICTGSAGSQQGPMGSLFNLVFPGGDRVSPSGAFGKPPNLLELRGLGPGQCSRGYVTYEITVGTSPSSVSYGLDPLRSYEWRLPAR
jgi:hypothetical protein